MTKVANYDLDGSTITDITYALVGKDKTHTSLVVVTKDAPGSNAATWNAALHGKSDLGVFYVRLTLGK